MNKQLTYSQKKQPVNQSLVLTKQKEEKKTQQQQPITSSLKYKPVESLYKKKGFNLKFKNSKFFGSKTRKSIYSKKNTVVKSKSRVKSSDLTRSKIHQKSLKTRSIEKKKKFDYKSFTQKFKIDINNKKLRSRREATRSKSRPRHDVFNSEASEKQSNFSAISEISNKIKSGRKILSKLKKNTERNSKSRRLRNKINTILVRSLSKKYKGDKEINKPEKGKIVNLIEDLKKENLQLYKYKEKSELELREADEEIERLKDEMKDMKKLHLQKLKTEKEKIFNLLEEKEEMTSIIEELINEITILKDEIKHLTNSDQGNFYTREEIMKRMNNRVSSAPTDWSRSTFKTVGDIPKLEIETFPFLHSIKEVDQEAEEYNSEKFQSHGKGRKSIPSTKASKICQKNDGNILTENKNLLNLGKKNDFEEGIQNELQEKIKNLEGRNKKLSEANKNLETNLKLLKAKYMQSLMSLRLEKVQVKELKRQIQFSNSSNFMDSVLENGKSLFNFETEDHNSQQTDNVN